MMTLFTKGKYIQKKYPPVSAYSFFTVDGAATISNLSYSIERQIPTIYRLLKHKDYENTILSRVLP